MSDVKYNSKVEELYEKKSDIWHKMKGMHEVDQAEWSAEDEARWNELDADIEQCDVDIEKEESAIARSARMELLQENREKQRSVDRPETANMRAIRDNRLPGRTHEEVRALAFAAWCRPALATEDQIFATKQCGLPWRQSRRS